MALKRYKKKLRYNEYYDMQKIIDELYRKSKENYNFYNLYDLIISDENLLLAYRTIKKNTGSKTYRANYHTIEFIRNMTEEEYLNYFRARLNDFKPLEVRRKMIPKYDGKERPLGIPCIEDRIIQQAIKQIIEPICEAKFHEKSYGFRSNRNAENAIAYMYKKINIDKCYYVVDINIKGFFDNVNHGKLLKQLWNIGIKDKRLLKIISKMLKAPIKNEGIPKKGVPQGGIISPVLANVVLNELDWWISSQWETSPNRDIKDSKHIYNKLRRKSKLKEMYIVRYADNFKILCKDKETAKRIFIAVKKWLKERLDLEISECKSKITNLQTNYSEFLGIKIKVIEKGNKKVVESHITDKAKEKIKKNLREEIIKLSKNPSGKEVMKYNSIILGIQNYYNMATHINLDLNDIFFHIRVKIETRLKRNLGKSGYKPKIYKEKYKGYKFKEYYIDKIIMYPLGAIKHKKPMQLSKEVNNYTENGRKYIHDKLKSGYNLMLNCLIENPIINRSVEYNDNRLSKYTGQKGLSAISKTVLGKDMELHHIIPISKGGNDDYDNLILITNEEHRFIHATDSKTIEKYKKLLNLNMKELEKINKYRIKVENNEI